MHFLRGTLRLRPPARTKVPSWDLAIVLEALSRPPFEPLVEVPERFFTVKTVFLLAISSLKRVGDFQALSVAPSFLEFAPGVAKAFLYPKPGYLPKVPTVVPRPIVVQAFCPPHFRDSEHEKCNLICPVRVLDTYDHRAALWRRFYPKILSDLILDSYVISFHMCSLQIYVIYSSLLSEITILTVMAYDRYVAICKPLDYHSKLTKNTCVKLILFSWIVPNCICITAVLLSNLRPICKYHIDKLYCDNWSVVKLACVSSFVNNVFGYAISVIFFSFIVLIIVSYFKLISACKASLENRKKFCQTCLPHILSLINFTIALLFDIMYSRYGANDIPESLRNFLALELVIVPPVFNPLIYGLNITVVRTRVFTLCN
ncbi:olfactory receptor 4S2-like [Sinocyclocheilus grahami]|uniref:olfactory receptor 4S2-like n=1 Tax=Sinocyclocheilus grahami TaxID=75366 RepID=UPI0007AD2B85|nr:PREDICTED: olfactory receptor 4S2-like [Sinocyclocheilus grahami]